MHPDGLPVPAPPFRVGVSRSDGLVALPEEGRTRVILDLSHLQFIDSTGLSVLVMALNRSRADGGSVLIRHPSQAVLRILEITGLVSVFAVETKEAVLPPEPRGTGGTGGTE